MRRATLTALFLGVLVLAFSFYFLRSKHAVSESGEEPRVDDQLPIQGAPRLGVSHPTPAPQRHSALAGLDAAIDAGGLVLDEQSLMQKSRMSLGKDPALAEAFAREGRARFGDSLASDERDFILVKALLNQLNIESARSEAYYYFAHHPGHREGVFHRGYASVQQGHAFALQYTTR